MNTRLVIERGHEMHFRRCRDWRSTPRNTMIGNSVADERFRAGHILQSGHCGTRLDCLSEACVPRSQKRVKATAIATAFEAA